MKKTLLGIDFGTGGAKACILDSGGQVLAYAFREYPLLHPRPGWSEHHADSYWDTACALIRQVLVSCGVDTIAVAGVGISSALPSLVLVDEAGEVLAPALNLMDRRATSEVESIRETLDMESVARLTANRIEDHPSLVNLLWFKNHRPDIYARVHKALTIDGYINYKLTGRFTLNASAGAFYGLAYDIRALRFDEAVLAQLGLSRELLPDVCDSRTVVGEVNASAAKDCGLPVGVQVVGGQVDCNAGWLAGGAVDPGDMQLNLGTCGVLGLLHGSKEFLTSPQGQQMVNIPYTTDAKSTYAAVAVTTTGGQSLRYLRDTIGSVETATAQALGLSTYDLMTLQAKDVPVGSEGLVVLPYLMGERSPIWDVNARACIIGLSLHHTRGHIIRAFMEGVALALRDSFDVLMSSGLTVNGPLVCNEGGAKSDVWRRIVTDVLGVPTVVLQGSVGAPEGDAILAGVGVGVFDDFYVAADRATTGGLMEPDKRNHDRYSEYFNAFRRMYRSLAPEFGQLRDIVERS